MSSSKLDKLIRTVVISRFFKSGWGDPDDLKRLFYFRHMLSDRNTCNDLVAEDHLVHLEKIERYHGYDADYLLYDGYTISPLAKACPGLLPKVAETSRFQLIVPVDWDTADKALCFQMAGTGDHYFWRRRRLMALPLLQQHGVSSLILENPFYGSRKPHNQFRSSLRNVSDIFVMGGSLMLESLALLRWCDKEGFGPICLHGISMGGHMASLSATNWKKPIALVPCLSWTTASGVFTTGVMSLAIDWDTLEEQYHTNAVYRKQIEPLLTYNYNAKVGYYPSDFEEDVEEEVKPSKMTQLMYRSKKSVWTRISKIAQWFLKHIPTGQGTVRERIENVERSAQTAMKKKPKSRRNTQHYNLLSPSRSRGRDPKTMAFMRGVMDECTHLRNFPKPVDTGLIIIVAARYDAYVPREGEVPLNQIWPGSELRYIENGHISGYLLRQAFFRNAICDALSKHRVKYHPDGTPREFVEEPSDAPKS